MSMWHSLTGIRATITDLLYSVIRRKSTAEVEMTSGWQITKDEFLQMPLEEKRKFYKFPGRFVELTTINSWQNDTANHETTATTDKDVDGTFPVNKELNEKVSIFTGDITTLEIDAIVNAANRTLLGGGGVDGAIHRAAGPDLVQECKTLGGCETGEAKMTGGYQLPAKHVIHTVGPIGEHPDLLTNCYERSLNVMKDNNLRSIAFPCISTGVYGYPNEPAAKIALSTTRKFLEAENNAQQVDRIIFCLFLDKDKAIYKNLLQKYFPIQ